MEYTLYALVSSSNVADYRYIGVTCKSLKERLGRHIRDHVKLKSYRANWIRNEFKKQNAILIIPLISHVCPDEISDLEIEQIAKYKKLGYKLTNTTIGGEGVTGYKWSVETRKKIELQRESINKKISQANKGRISNPKFIEEFAIKKRRAVFQLDLNGNVLSKYLSASDAAKVVGLNAETIRKACDDISIKTRGFIFIYESNFNIEYVNLRLDKIKSRWKSRNRDMFYKPVEMFDLKMSYIKTFKSIKHAKESTGAKHISEVCNNKRKSCSGFIFKFK